MREKCGAKSLLSWRPYLCIGETAVLSFRGESRITQSHHTIQRFYESFTRISQNEIRCKT